MVGRFTKNSSIPADERKENKIRRKCVLAIMLGIFILVMLPFAAVAADEKWPARPITIYIGYSPGGGWS